MRKRSKILAVALSLSMSICVGVQSVQAIDIGGYGAFTDLQKAIVNGTDPIIKINITGNIDRRLMDSAELGQINPALSRLDIYGNKHSLTGLLTNSDNPIIVSATQELNISDLKQNEFTQFITNNGGSVSITSSKPEEFRSSYYNNDGVVFTNNDNGIFTISYTDIRNNSMQAIVNNSGQVNLENVIINENMQGLLNKGTAYIGASSFENNSNNSSQGAAIDNSGTVYIKDSNFTGNSTSHNGGAITNAGGLFYAENIDFDGNSATANGGAVDTWGATGVATFIDSSFRNNHTNEELKSDEGYTYSGGAITNNDNGTLNIAAINKDVEFTDNYIGKDNRFGIIGSDNRQSNAIANMGTVYLNASEGRRVVFNDAIGNSKNQNGVININSADATLVNGSGDSVITPTAGTIEFNNTVSNQTINMYGGIVKLGASNGKEDFNKGKLGSFDVTAENHVSLNYYGGVLDLINGSSDSTNIGWLSLYEDMDVAIDAIGSHADYLNTSETVGNSNFDTNGHTVYFSKINLGDATKFEGLAGSLNSADWENFGVKANTELVGSGNISNLNTLVSYNNNTGILKVGAYSLQDAVAETEGTRYYRLQQTENVVENLGEMLNTGILTIVGNSQAINGRGFSGIVVGEGDELVINNVSSFGGFNSTTGAVINAISGVVNITNTNLENNSAVNGGAIAMSGNSNVTLTDSRISGNTAVNGGGIYTDGAGINLTLNNSNIEANRAEEGAAIYNNGSTNIVINNTSITENIGNSSIYNNNGKLTINSNNGGVLVIDNKLSEDDENGVIKNIGSLELNAFDKSEINISDKILGLSNKRDDNIISINNNSQEGIVSILGGIENSVLTVKAGTANIGDVINSMINADGVGTSISGNITNSNITASADNTSISGTVNGSMIATSSKTTLITADVSNGSTITSNSGTTTITGTVGNSTITSSSGQMAVESSVKNSQITTTGGTTTLSGEISDNSKILNNGTGMTEISGTVSGSSVSTTKGKTTITESGIIKDGSTVTTNGSGKTEIRGEVTGSSTINNSGGETTISNSVSNSTVNVSGGSVEVTSTGIINGTQVNVTNGNANIGGSVTTGSTVRTTYGTTNISGTVSGSEIITIAQGQTTISGNVSNNSSIFNSGLGTTTITGVVKDSNIVSLGGKVNINNSILDSAIAVTNSTVNIGIVGQDINFAGTTLSIGKASPDGKGDEDGTANLLASAINSGEINLNTENSVLNTSQNSKIASSIKGNGVINKTGNTVLRFSNLNNSNGSDFTGNINIKDGQLVLDSSYKLNADANINIENAILDYTVGTSTINDGTIANIILKDGAEANIIGSSYDSSITLSGKFWEMQGAGKLTLKDANYILGGGANPFTTGDDLINFEKAQISFIHSDDASHNYGNIALNENSMIELADGHGGDSHNFENIISNGENYFNTDIDLHLDNVSSNPISDKLVVNNGSGKLTLTELYITDDNGLMGQIAGGKVIQLIENKNPEKVLQLEDVKDIDILSWATNIYKYGVTSESSGFKDSTGKEVIDSIRVENNGPSSTDTLRDLNIYQGKDGNNNNRGFSFLVDADGNSTYNIYRDLNQTNKGVFTILGKANSTGDENFEKSVLSGILKDLQVEVKSNRIEYDAINDRYIYKSADETTVEAYINPEDVRLSDDNEYYIVSVGAIGDEFDTQGSMFELTDKLGSTSFKIEDLIIENAKRYERDTIKDGSVIYADSSSANIVLNNTDFRSNSVDAGNGGAIANISSEKFSITNGIFIENTAKSGLGGAIYNAEKAEMSIVAENSGLVQFAGNSAEKGGAIYNAGVLTMSATNSDSKIVVEAGTSDATNDIYNTGTLNLLGNIEINSGINDDKSNPSGITNVSGTLKLGDTAQIIQKGLQIATGGVISTNANNLTINNGITNDGTLEFKGNGTNNNIIKHSSGNTTSDLIISGNVENKDGVSITQNGLTITGSLIANASDLAINNGITNDGTLEFKGNGINKNTIKNSSGNTTSNLVISGNVENIDGVSIAQNDLTITGSLAANASDLVINNGITNDGTLEFKGNGTNNNTIKNSQDNRASNLIISGNVENIEGVSITQNDLTIIGSLIANASDLAIKNGITNDGTLEFKGNGINKNTIKHSSGNTTSNLVISGNVENIDGVSIAQNDLTITGSLIANASDLVINNGITNNGALEFKGSGTNNNDINGTGSTTIVGSVINEALIQQEALIISDNGGSLTTSANNIITTSNKITNNGTLVFNSGVNNNTVEGTGTTEFAGTEEIINNALILQNVLTNGKVQNNGKISGNLNVGSGITDNSGVIVGNVVISGGELISLAENLATGAGSEITNNSSLIISGILDKEILGQGTTTIRNDAVGKTLTLVEGGGVKGTLNLNDGILNMIDDNSAANKINEHEIGKLAGNGEIRIDVDMSPLNPDSSANSDKLIINDAENNTVVNLNTINITADHAYPDDPDLYVEKVIQVIDTQSKDNVIFNVGTDGKTSTMTSDYLYTFEKTENHGELRVQLDKTTAGLADFIQGISGAETVYNYSMTRDESSMDIPPEAIGITHRDNIPTGGLNVYMNGHNLSGNNNEGITVAEDYILNVIGSGGTISNFETAFKVNEGGELNLSNITFKDNDLALNNAGELNLSNINFSGNSTAIENFGELNLSSTNTISGGIIGDGTINIISGSTEFSGAVEQGKISVSQNSGLIGSADDIKIVQGIENNGNIIFTGGKNTNTITGNGLIDFADGMENSGVITQGTVILSNTFTNKGSMEITNTLDNGGIITNDGLIVLSGDNISNNGTISNNNKLVLSGEYIKNSGLIDGTGTTEIAGKVQNTGTIAQDIEINESGELTSQAGNIKKDIHNDGTYNVLGGMIQNTISGTGNLNLSNNTVIGSEITGNKINLNNGILSFVQDADISGASLVANGGSINFQNNAIENTNLGNLILNSDLNITIDGSFAEHELDTISVNGFTNNGSYHINISNILLSTPTEDLSFSISPIGSDMDVTVQNALAGAIQYTGGEIIYSPIYKYSAKYDPDTALMNFNRIGGGGYNSYNPGVFAGAVASQLGGYLTQLNSYDEAFRNMDMYMLMTKEQRQAMKLRNKYSSTSSNIVYDPTINQYENKAGWFRPYATFEKVDLKGGPTVSNVSYGSFFGAESEMMDLGHGWDGIWGVYGGYNGSHQAYDGIGIYQNGGTLGVIGMAYKGNFFTGLTVNAGANSGEASTMYGQDNFTMLMSGVASKSGYNWELAKGKFIIQPNFLMSYSYVNTFNYKDAQGVSISSDPLHAIQIEPGIKLIGNLKNGWQPYMSVSMVWNIMDKTEFQANNVALPELSIKPFVKYGVGVRKSWGERFTGFFQTYFTNGGRNGVGLQLGLRWMLGKNPAKKSLNGPVPELKKTEIKVGRR